ncbi:hypothetical protein [Microcoleus sp. CAWBG27]|uniref:hypothetical protein n=1 Tax=Microcoleus sp. CAWBG27 TaxID=2841645 RepID=UPI0025D5468C|nr:hypothetical protein [Microcoleus sp. CAWBG27]
MAPILRDNFWLSTPLKRFHYLEVWRSSTNPHQFGYRLAYGGSLYGDLKDEFDTPELALEAGINDTKGLLTPAVRPI